MAWILTRSIADLLLECTLSLACSSLFEMWSWVQLSSGLHVLSPSPHEGCMKVAHLAAHSLILGCTGPFNVCTHILLHSSSDEARDYLSIPILVCSLGICGTSRVHKKCLLACHLQELGKIFWIILLIHKSQKHVHEGPVNIKLCITISSVCALLHMTLALFSIRRMMSWNHDHALDQCDVYKMSESTTGRSWHRRV